MLQGSWICHPAFAIHAQKPCPWVSKEVFPIQWSKGWDSAHVSGRHFAWFSRCFKNMFRSVPCSGIDYAVPLPCSEVISFIKLSLQHNFRVNRKETFIVGPPKHTFFIFRVKARHLTLEREVPNLPHPKSILRFFLWEKASSYLSVNHCSLLEFLQKHITLAHRKGKISST